MVVHHGSSRCLSGVFRRLPNSNKASLAFGVPGRSLKEPLRCLNAAQQSVFFFLFFLFHFGCKFTHPADLLRDAPSLPSSSAADRDLRLLATVFDIISIGSLLSVYLFFYLPFLHNKRGISMKGSPYWSNSHLPLFFFFKKKESCQLSLVLAIRK